MHSYKLISSLAAVLLTGMLGLTGLAACSDSGGGGSGGSGAQGGQGGEGGVGGQGGAAGQGGTGGAGGAGGASAETLCTMTGGTVGMGNCCTSAGDFPDGCAVGPCGCGPADSHMVKICQCPAMQCFDPVAGCKAM